MIETTENMNAATAVHVAPNLAPTNPASSITIPTKAAAPSEQGVLPRLLPKNDIYNEQSKTARSQPAKSDRRPVHEAKRSRTMPPRQVSDGSPPRKPNMAAADRHANSSGNLATPSNSTPSSSSLRGEASSVSKKTSAATRPRSTSKEAQGIGQRRFPGPAGILPPLVSASQLSKSTAAAKQVVNQWKAGEQAKKVGSNPTRAPPQPAVGGFDSGAWITMLLSMRGYTGYNGG